MYFSIETVNSWCRSTSQGYLDGVFEENAALPYMTVISTGGLSKLDVWLMDALYSIYSVLSVILC